MNSLLEAQLKEASMALETFSISNFLQFQEVQDWAPLYAEVGKNGTNQAKNDADPMGDGDQSPFSAANENHAQFHRELWAAGGDLIHQGSERSLPAFILYCLSGNLRECKKILQSCKNDEAKKVLLETRYCILRQPALMFAIVGYENGVAAGFMEMGAHLEVVKLLIEHGARCDAKDLCGKTMLHYCLGRLCLEGDDTLKHMADAVIARTKELNLSPPLVDTPDRYGDVPLIDTIMIRREDLVDFLCTKHGADPYIKDNYGICPTNMIKNSCAIGDIMVKAKNKANYRVQKHQCHNCLKTDVETSKCGKCKVATYCSRECQVAHWKVHKKECLSQGITEVILMPNMSEDMYSQQTQAQVKQFDGSPPAGVQVNEYFDIKIQLCLDLRTLGQEPVLDPEQSYMLYNKARDLITYVSDRNCSQRAELFKLISTFPAFKGQKAYFRAKVSEKGMLCIATQPIFVRKW